MLALCNAAVVKALLVLAGLVTGGVRVPATTVISCAPPAAVCAPAPRDTVRPAKPSKKPAKSEKGVTITITDEGIRLEGEGTTKIELDARRLEELNRKLGRDVLERLEGLPESLEALLGEEYDAKRFYRVRGSDIVQFGKRVKVGENELVNGNVVTIGADVAIEGKVTGDVAAIFGSVKLGPEAIVNGEVVSIFGSVDRENGAVIRGETAVIGGGYRRHPGVVFPLGPFGEGIFGGVGRIASFIIGILLMLILLFFIPRRMRNAADYASASFPKSLGMGLLLFFGGMVLVVILAIILAITIVGIPVAVLLVLSYAALLGIGYSVSALALGSFAARKFNIEGDSIFLQAIVGLFFLAILGIVSSFMFWSPILGPARVMLRVIGGIVQFAAVLVGTGAFLLSKAGSRGTGPVGAPAQETSAR